MKLLINNSYKKIYSDKIDQDLNISEGVIKKEEYNSITDGLIKTHKGKNFLIKNPDFKDLLFSIKRGPQIITLKDAGFIASNLGLMNGFRVLDCGGGSGSISCFFANIVGKKGKVISVEKNEKFCEIIKSNVKLFGFENIEVINKDLSEYSSKKLFDAINIDLPNPWDYSNKISSLLKNGSRLTLYIPNTTQLTHSQQDFCAKGFKLEHVFELILREWDVNDLVCHPKFDMLGHTGFIMCFRKIMVE
ncbi:MAG: methyltransferase domain-containing protein [Candidatus Nanoarchaeia archaeon]|nr:methyltransferase domain-containing protein [Candidatus Nanoarchaeia archaeon]